ncbi:MAG: hypothetical protein ACI8QC_001564 [Planctomycetota bacterium]|jgi:hypothetical protein
MHMPTTSNSSAVQQSGLETRLPAESQTISTRSRSRIGGRYRGLAKGLCVGLSLFMAACSGGGSSFTAVNTGSDGTPFAHPDGSGFFLSEAHQAGAATDMKLQRMSWGRLVQVFGLTNEPGARKAMFTDFVISSGIANDGFNYELETNPVTAQQTLLIMRNVEDEATGGGLDQFYNLLRAAEANLIPVEPKAQAQAGIYTMVPRNATLVLQFDDMIDASTVDEVTMRVLSGVPSMVPFEGRLVVDRNHGGLANHDGIAGAEFYSTRILIDPTVTEIESFSFDPPLPPNGEGFPGSTESNLSNLLIRIPTMINSSIGQNRLMTNPTDHALANTANGPVDFASPTVDVVRGMRSGGRTEVTGDPTNGFLTDGDPPRVVGSTPVDIINAPQQDAINPLEFTLAQVDFQSVVCSQSPEVGDVIAQSNIGLFAEIVAPAPTNTQGTLADVHVRLLLYPSEWDEPGREGPLEWQLSGGNLFGEFRAAFDPILDAGRVGCFVTITPQNSGFPANPDAGLRTDSRIGVRFSEPMDPASLNAFDSVTLTREPLNPDNDPPLLTSDYVVGRVEQSLDLQEYTFVPDLDLSHEVGSAENYFLTLLAGDAGPTDLSGNSLFAVLPVVELFIDPNAPQKRNGGRVSRFVTADEEPPVGDEVTGLLPEWNGQHLFDLGRELIRPRPVSRFLAVADRTQGIIALQTPFEQGIQTPLSNFGSKMQTLYRYADFGWGLTDLANINVDVEGINWTPVGGQVAIDQYEEFMIRVSHCKFAADEYINPASLFPAFANSGLKGVFENNPLNGVTDPMSEVHPKELGFIVNPGDQFLTASNTKMMPYPLNRDVAPEDRRLYTWRDSVLPDRAGPQSGGVPPRQQLVALGLDPNSPAFYNQGKIQTIGLPLLMEFRCYPDDNAVGLNSFDINLAANTSSKPYFRAFSTGGIDTNGNPIAVDPDIETNSNGGFNPASQPTPGAVTYGRDNVFYLGALDIVVRVSRSVSVWYPATNPQASTPFAAPYYSPAVIEPSVESQPQGTSVEVSYRGAVEFEPYEINGTVEHDPHEALTNALSLDIYGNHYDDHAHGDPFFALQHNSNKANLFMTFFDTNEDWMDDVATINGASYYQLRLTFKSNEQTGLSPELSAIAVAWQEESF